jgi:iron complex transport system permease protein
VGVVILDIVTKKISGIGFLILIILLIAIFLLNLSLGSVKIPIKVIGKLLLGGESPKESWSTIVYVFRFPKAITALLAGAALSVAGLLMQTLFRNPLAGPSVLGINSGASLGVALVVMATSSVGASKLLTSLGGAGDLGLALAASLGAGLVMLLVVTISKYVKSVMTLLILGLLFGYAANAVVTILMHFSISQHIQTYISWTFGSFGGVTWTNLAILAPIAVAGLLASMLLIKPLNAFLLGERYAESMGAEVKKIRIFLIILTALLSGTVTAFCGPIGFIGVAIPHLTRSIFGTSDHKVLIPATILLGSIAALAAELIAQLPGTSTVLPLNAVTALIGTPVIVWVILRKRNLKETFAA